MDNRKKTKRNHYRRKIFTTKSKNNRNQNNKSKNKSINNVSKKFFYEIICKKPKNKNQYIIQKTQKLIEEVKKSNLLAAS
jgi:hypothetical protein